MTADVLPPLDVDTGTEAGTPGRGRRLGSWARANRVLLAIAVLGIVVRLFMVLVAHPTCDFDERVFTADRVDAIDASTVIAPRGQARCTLGGDAYYLFAQGRLLAEGELFISPAEASTGRISPGAAKPPAYPVMIAALHVVGFDGVTDSRVAVALLGGCTVLATGVLARRLAGRRAGWMAAGMAAVYPMMLINDWRGLQDGVAALPVVLTVMAAYTFMQRPSPKAAAVVGLGIVTATFFRSELSILGFFLLPPMAWSLKSLRLTSRLRLGLAAALTALVIVGPWITFNMARFNNPTTVVGGAGSALLNGSCDAAWYGNNMGWLDFECFSVSSFVSLERARAGSLDYDESDISDSYSVLANEYIRANLRRYPVVAMARIGRAWDVYRPQQNLNLNILIEGRGDLDSRLGLAMYAVLAPFTLVGLGVMIRRRVPVSPIVAVLLGVSFAAALSFGLTRYRAPAEPLLAVAAAVAFDALWRRRANGSWLIDDDPDALSWPSPAQVSPVDDRAWWQRLDDTALRQRVLGSGAVLGLAFMAVLVWSSGAEPKEQAKPITNSPACAVAATAGIDDISVYGTLGPTTVGAVLEGFRQMRAVAPEDLYEPIDTIVGYLSDLEAQGVSGGQWLQGLTQDERTELFGAAQVLLTFSQERC